MSPETSRGTLVVGLDWATQENARGLALGVVDADLRLEVREVRGASREEPALGIVAGWLREDRPALICMDAPLGWPEALPRMLATHQAGQAIDALPGEMFSRHADWFVSETIGKRPLEVGANFIARTALSALAFLGELRTELRQPLPLAWNQGAPERTSVIETYPAGTLAARGMLVNGYKASREKRERLLGCGDLRDIIRFGPDSPDSPARLACLEDEHRFDAVLCLLAGRDFLAEDCLTPTPEKMDTIRKEGWIWVRYPEVLHAGDPCGEAGEEQG